MKYTKHIMIYTHLFCFLLAVVLLCASCAKGGEDRDKGIAVGTSAGITDQPADGTAQGKTTYPLAALTGTKKMGTDLSEALQRALDEDILTVYVCLCYVSPYDGEVERMVEERYGISPDYRRWDYFNANVLPMLCRSVEQLKADEPEKFEAGQKDPVYIREKFAIDAMITDEELAVELARQSLIDALSYIKKHTASLYADLCAQEVAQKRYAPFFETAGQLGVTPRPYGESGREFLIDIRKDRLGYIGGLEDVEYLNIYFNEEETREMAWMYENNILFAGSCEDCLAYMKRYVTNDGFEENYYQSNTCSVSFAITSAGGMARLSGRSDWHNRENFDVSLWDDAFFEDHFLLLTYMIEGSGSNRHIFAAEACRDESVDVYRLQTYPRRLGEGTCTADVKYGFYVTVVPVKYSGQTIHYYVGVAS